MNPACRPPRGCGMPQSSLSVEALTPVTQSPSAIRKLPRRIYYKMRSIVLRIEFELKQALYRSPSRGKPAPEPVRYHIPRPDGEDGLPPAPPVVTYGFDPASRERDWSDLAVRRGDPGWVEETDLLYLPSGRVVQRSGLYRLDGSVVPETLIHRGETQINGHETDFPAGGHAVEERPVVYAGHMSSFSHFISEGLSSLRLAASLDRPDLLWLFHGRDPAASGWGREFLRLLGIPPERFVAFERPTLLKRVIVPRPAFILSDSIWSGFTDFTASLGRRALGERLPAVTDRPLYLSRSRLHISQRSLGNERALERWLAERGALIYHPQDHPLVEQIRTINAHRRVIGCYGGAYLLGLFSARPAQNVYFAPNLQIQTYMLIDNVKGSESIWIQADEMRAWLKRHENMGRQNMMLDPDRIAAVLGQHGF
jgi:capsular polysaccharide biosynthesis protein